MANNWCTIESDPGERLELPSPVRTSSSDGWCLVSGVFTELMRGIGVKGVQVTPCLALLHCRPAATVFVWEAHVMIACASGFVACVSG